MIQLKTLRNKKIIYSVALAILSVWFLTSGILEVTRNPTVWDKTIKMGYPPYFILLLGIAKISGVIVLLGPARLNGLKEWVFAALTFDVIFAFASGWHLGKFWECLIPTIAFMLILFTYIMFRRINPVFRSIFGSI